MVPVTPASEPGQVRSVKLRITLPETHWLGNLTRRHPGTMVQIQTMLSLPDRRTLLDLALIGADHDFSRELQALPGVESVHRHGDLPRHERYRVECRDAEVIEVILEHRMLLHLPICVQGGRTVFATVDQLPRVRRFVRALKEAGIPAEITSMRPPSSGVEGFELTPTEREVFDRALVAGYFEVPREINLTQLAKDLGRSKSGVSRTLAMVEKKLVDLASRGTCEK